MNDSRARARAPSSTYRLQLHQELGFKGATALVEYLHRLGITDCYTSSILAAAPGSNHGYDVVDHTRLDPVLGSEAELLELGAALRTRDMGFVLDVVPNHMCIASSLNTWWTDVLENGPSSPYAHYFDIDWDPPKADLKARVLLPILGDQYGSVLERGEIQIRYEHDTFVACYGDVRLPIAPRTWSHVFEPMLEEMRTSCHDHQHVQELESILTSLTYLPLRTDTDRVKVRERRREKEVVKRRLAGLLRDCPDAGHALKRSLEGLNRRSPESVDRLETLLADQGYRPSYWRVAADEINYRRFFDINELAAIRVEEQAVLRAVHAIPLKLVKQGVITGLRIDHVDGLLAPGRYLDELRRALAAASAPPVYLVVEKILAPGETLRGWPVQGTTGYEVATLLTGLLLEPTGVAALGELYEAFTEQHDSFDDVVYESKRLVLKSAMSAELTVLARKLDDISEQHRATRDFTLNSLHEALGELVACFPIYRTYIDPSTTSVGETDQRYIQAAIAQAKQRNPVTSESIYDFLADLLLLRHPPGIDNAQLAARRDFVLRFQQLTSPVMAKGLEDTAFYRVYPLAACNEVGGPAAPVSIDRFHATCARRAAETPLSMSSTSTHDTKRGEDVRARLCVLSEVPTAWRSSLLRLAELAAASRPSPHVPSWSSLYLLVQTLVGAWPPGMDTPDAEFVERIQRYMNKALKEAKINTSWINPNETYDSHIRQFIATILSPDSGAAFVAELTAVRKEVDRAGWFNSLVQVVLKIGMPGVPDFYQGSELWNLSLVDPDNRRTVDFDARKRMLDELLRDGEAAPGEYVDRLRSQLPDPRIKMWVTTHGLRARRRHRAAFERGSYAPIATRGEHRDRVIAFTRSHEAEHVHVVCGRFFTAVAPRTQDPIGAAWGDTTIDLGSASTLRDVLTGRRFDGQVLALRDVFAHLPVAMLEART